MATEEPLRCLWCRRPVEQRVGPGRPRLFCCPSHRQRSYEARKRAGSFHLPEDQCIVGVGALQDLHDRLYQLEAAVEDVRSDLVTDRCPAAYQEALEHLLGAAEGLVGLVVEPLRE